MAEGIVAAVKDRGLGSIQLSIAVVKIDHLPGNPSLEDVREYYLNPAEEQFEAALAEGKALMQSRKQKLSQADTKFNGVMQTMAKALQDHWHGQALLARAEKIGGEEALSLRAQGQELLSRAWQAAGKADEPLREAQGEAEMPPEWTGSPTTGLGTNLDGALLHLALAGEISRFNDTRTPAALGKDDEVLHITAWANAWPNAAEAMSTWDATNLEARKTLVWARPACEMPGLHVGFDGTTDSVPFVESGGASSRATARFQATKLEYRRSGNNVVHLWDATFLGEFSATLEPSPSALRILAAKIPAWLAMAGDWRLLDPARSVFDGDAPSYLYESMVCGCEGMYQQTTHPKRPFAGAAGAVLWREAPALDLVLEQRQFPSDGPHVWYGSNYAAPTGAGAPAFLPATNPVWYRKAVAVYHNEATGASGSWEDGNVSGTFPLWAKERLHVPGHAAAPAGAYRVIESRGQTTLHYRNKVKITFRDSDGREISKYQTLEVTLSDPWMPTRNTRPRLYADDLRLYAYSFPYGMLSMSARGTARQFYGIDSGYLFQHYPYKLPSNWTLRTSLAPLWIWRPSPLPASQMDPASPLLTRYMTRLHKLIFEPTKPEDAAKPVKTELIGAYPTYAPRELPVQLECTGSTKAMSLAVEREDYFPWSCEVTV
ncbi:MAG: hypothetical protein IAE97_06280 [Chthoniobacterales bacterium]|nr:hypothetical protein [Chthoniobacterales bacterium]